MLIILTEDEGRMQSRLGGRVGFSGKQHSNPELMVSTESRSQQSWGHVGRMSRRSASLSRHTQAYRDKTLLI